MICLKKQLPVILDKLKQYKDIYLTKYLFLINIITTGDIMEEKFINFLKKYNLYREEIFKYIKPRTRRIDYKDNNAFNFIGVYANLDNNDILRDIKMVVPYMVDDNSIAINIHEYIHLLYIYDYLNKEYVFNNYEELLPVLYELMYSKENNNVEYINMYINHIKEEDNYLKVLLDIYDFEEEKEYNKIKSK